MAVKIRLTRVGKTKQPQYRVIAADSRRARDGRFIERLGFYNPIASGSEQGLRLSLERIEYWKSHGAQVSPTVQRLIKQFAKQAAAPAAA